MRSLSLGLSSLLLLTAATRGGFAAEPTKAPSVLQARDTSWVNAEAWRYSVGVFNPLRVSVGRQLELEAHPLLFWVAPHMLVRAAHQPLDSDCGSWGLTGEYGLALPTPGMRLLQGHLFPAWEHHEGQIGWSVVPQVGLVTSWRTGSPWASDSVFTARSELSVGVPLTHSDAQPLDAPQPLNLVFAPVLSRYRGRLGAAWDTSLHRRVRLQLYADVYLHGVERNWRWPQGAQNITARWGVSSDVGFGQALNKRLSLGVAWWNSEQHAIDPETWEPERSNDVWPTLDFIWEG